MYWGFRSCKNSASWGTKWGTFLVRPNVRPNDRKVRPNDKTYDQETVNMHDRTDMWMCGRTTERVTCNRPKNTHRIFFIRKNLLWAVNFKFLVGIWLDIQWRNPHSQQQFVLNVGYPIARLFTKACVLAPQTLWSVSLPPKLTLINFIQTTLQKKNARPLD